MQINTLLPLIWRFPSNSRQRIARAIRIKAQVVDYKTPISMLHGAIAPNQPEIAGIMLLYYVVHSRRYGITPLPTIVTNLEANCAGKVQGIQSTA